MSVTTFFGSRPVSSAKKQTAALPDIGEAALAFGLRLFRDAIGFGKGEKFCVFDNALLKTKRFASGRISRGRRRLPK